MVHLIARAVENVPPLNDLATRAAELRGAARRAVDRLAEKSNNALHGARDAKPRAVTISRAHNPLRHGNFAAMIPGDSAVETVITSGLFSTLNIYNTLLIGRLILTVRRHGTHPYPTRRASARPLTDPSARSLPPLPRPRASILPRQWFPNPPRQLAYPLATLCDPYLNLFRGIIPPIGGTIDLSPILAFTVLNVFTNTAAALPCEIGEDGEPIVTERRGMWAKRLAAAAKRRAEHNAAKTA